MAAKNQHEIDKHRLEHTPPFEAWEKETSIPDRFRRIVSQFPQRPAIICAQETLTYHELDIASDLVAAELLRVREAQQEVVSLYLEQSPNLIIAALGILKAGKIFLALHPGLPHLRLQQLFSQANGEIIISSATSAQNALKLFSQNGKILDVDVLRRSRIGSRRVVIGADQTALLLPTSGSTGEPKLVMRTHKAMLHNVWNSGHGYFSAPGDRFGLAAFLGYGAGCSSTFNILLSGSTLVLLQVEGRSPVDIVNQLRTLTVSITMMSAPLLAQILASVEGPDDLPDLRQVRSAGQTLHAGVVHDFRRKLGQRCFLINGLASSEMIGAAHWVIPNDFDLSNGNVPVGYPVVGMEILILDEMKQPVPAGETGEIAVRSRYVSQGYWRDPDLTTKSFLPDPMGSEKRIYLTGDLGKLRHDGMLEHHGRLAYWTKIRGYKVQLAEVETSLMQLDQIQTAVVLARPDLTGNDRLIAYIVTSNGQSLNTTNLRRHIKTALPEYMIPSYFVFLDQFPLLSNGKVDRQALPEPDRSRPELDAPFTAPQTTKEVKLALIWSEVLNINPVGINDNFFDLGGQSLLAANVTAQINADFEVNLSVKSLFEAPTIKSLIRLIDNESGRLNKDQDRDLKTKLRMLDV